MKISYLAPSLWTIQINQKELKGKNLSVFWVNKEKHTNKEINKSITMFRRVGSWHPVVTEIS